MTAPAPARAVVPASSSAAGPRPDGGLTPAQIATLLVLVQAQAAVRKQLTQTAVAAILAPFKTFNGWWSDDAVTAAVAKALKTIQPTQRQAARITDAFYARAVKTMTGKSTSTAGAVDVTKLRTAITPAVAEKLIAGELRPGWVVLGDTHDGPGEHIDTRVPMVVAASSSKATDPAEPYVRVAEQYRYQVAVKGATAEQARRNALVQLETAASTDVTLAVRAQYEKSGRNMKVRDYRRILHPEMSASGPCGLCVVAADRVYHIEDLQPIHNLCCCETLPVIDGMDPGIVLNYDDLEKVYAAAGGTGAKGLKKIRVALAEHGELGPTLVDADQNHRGPADVAKRLVRDQSVSWRAELAELEKTFQNLQRRQAAGEDVDRPLNYQATRVDKLRGLLGASS